jgi:uncharacterized protein (TIGR02217 family)
VRVAVDAVELSSGWSVDPATGLVSLDTPPAGGLEVTAGFEFDVPCRFAADALPLAMESYKTGAAEVGLVELVNP